MWRNSASAIQGPRQPPNTESAYQGFVTTMLVLTFFEATYVQPNLDSPVTMYVTDGTDFLLSVELFTLHLPVASVVQVVAPDPADHVPVTVTPATAPAAGATWIVTVAVQPLRPAGAVVAERLPTHICWVVGGELTVTDDVVDAVAPALSVTVSVTV